MLSDIWKSRAVSLASQRAAATAAIVVLLATGAFTSTAHAQADNTVAGPQQIQPVVQAPTDAAGAPEANGPLAQFNAQLAKHPNGGPELAIAVAVIVQANPELASLFLQAAQTASPAQAQAIGTGFFNAVAFLQAENSPVAANIASAIAASNNPIIKQAFGSTDDEQTAAVDQTGATGATGQGPIGASAPGPVAAASSPSFSGPSVSSLSFGSSGGTSTGGGGSGSPN